MTEDNDDFVEPLDAVQDEAGDSNRTLKIIGIILLVLVVLCLCVISLPVIVITLLSLLGPSLGNVFSDIINGI